MNKRLRGGKSSELIVAGWLLRHGLDVYQPLVDDQGVDLVVRQERAGGPEFYDIQVKSVNGYNRIVGIRNISRHTERYIVVIHYRHDKANKEDEILFLTKKQVEQHTPKGTEWGDLIINKAEREHYAHQTLEYLAQSIRNDVLLND